MSGPPPKRMYWAAHAEDLRKQALALRSIRHALRGGDSLEQWAAEHLSKVRLLDMAAWQL